MAFIAAILADSGILSFAMSIIEFNLIVDSEALTLDFRFTRTGFACSYLYIVAELIPTCLQISFVFTPWRRSLRTSSSLVSLSFVIALSFLALRFHVKHVHHRLRQGHQLTALDNDRRNTIAHIIQDSFVPSGSFYTSE